MVSKDNNQVTTISSVDELVRRGKERFPSRFHHRLCPYKPGGILEAGVVCADCVYGVVAERGGR